MWGNIAEESCDVCDCSSLIASTINSNTSTSHNSNNTGLSNPTTSATSMPSIFSMSSSSSSAIDAAAAAAAAPLRAQRRLMQFGSFDDTATIPAALEKTTDCADLSFYDCGSPARSCGSAPGSPSSCMMMDMDLFSPQTSPASGSPAAAAAAHSNNGSSGGGMLLLAGHHHHHHNNSTARSLQLQLVDYNSLDSGYEAGSNSSRNVLGAPTLSSSSLSSSASIASSGSAFKFAEPTGVAPKASPPKQQASAISTAATTTTSCFRPFNSAGTDSVDSMDDDYMELLDMEAAMEETDNDNALQSCNNNSNNALPSHFSSIISGTIRTPSPLQQLNGSRAPLRRCLSLIENNSNTANVPKTPEHYAIKAAMDVTPLTAAAVNYQRCLPTNNSGSSGGSSSSNGNGGRAFKRPEAPGFSPTLSKRFKMCESPMSVAAAADKENHQQQLVSTSSSSGSGSGNSSGATRHLIRKSMSMTDATSIMSALARSSIEPDLIGDFSKPYVLPLMAGGRHRDLKSISAATMARLLRGEYADRVSSFRVVDCRYPYEFEGGHIAGAENLYTQDDVLRVLVHSQRDRVAQVQPEASAGSAEGAAKRDIIVFHCEFSSERGPKLSRFLRNHDRQCNTNVYPALHYPEVYLLHGGYKEFYEQNVALCAPHAYRPMLDPAFGGAYKHFRAQTKSWNGGESRTAANADASGSGASSAGGSGGGGGGGGHRLMKSRSRLVL